MLIAAAVCPHPPLLVPEIAQGAAPELEVLRGHCRRAAAELGACGAQAVVAVGAGSRTVEHGAAVSGSLRGYGVDVVVGSGPEVLPLSLTLGAWIAEGAGVRLGGYVEVAAGASPQECLELGARAVAGRRTALLVMGDGSARRTERSPGPVHPRALGFDAEVAGAFAAADDEALAALDPAAAEALWAAGRPAWQVLAGAAWGAGLGGELLAHEAPYGVGYFVALWT